LDQDWKKSHRLRLQRAEQQQQALRDAQNLNARHPQAPTPPATTAFVDEVIPTETRDIRHYMANRDIGERTRKLWDDFAAEVGNEDEYENDDFVVPDDSDSEDDASDLPSEVSVYYTKAGETDEGSRKSPSVIDIPSDEDEDKVLETPRKRKRAAQTISTDEEPEADHPPTHLATPATRCSRRLAKKLYAPSPVVVHLPTPFPTPENQPTGSYHLRSTPRRSKKSTTPITTPLSPRQVVTEESSSDEYDDEPLSERLIRKQLPSITSPKKATNMRKASLTPSCEWAEDSPLASDVGDFIEDDTPTKPRSPQSPQANRVARFLFR